MPWSHAISLARRYIEEARGTPMAHVGLGMAWAAIIAAGWWLGHMGWPVLQQTAQSVQAQERRLTALEQAVVTLDERQERRERAALLAGWEAEIRAIEGQILSIEREIESIHSRGDAVPAIFTDQKQRLLSDKDALLRRINQLLRTYPELVGQLR